MIEGNSCLACHRSSIGLAYETFDGIGHVMINDFMPPHDPGSLAEDYNELIECWINGPENTDGCDWVIPPRNSCSTSGTIWWCNSDIQSLSNHYV